MAFIEATKRRHQASTCSDNINQTHPPPFFAVDFIVKLSKNASGHTCRGTPDPEEDTLGWRLPHGVWRET